MGPIRSFSRFWAALGGVALAGALLLAAPTAAEAQQNPLCDPPDVLLIVDYSNSMNWGMNGQQNGTPTKITVLRQAYQDLLGRFDKRIRFGLITYTTTVKQPPANYPNDICSYQSPVINLQVPVGPNTGQRCISILNSLRADGCTPMVPALQGAVQHYQTTVIPNDTLKSRRRFVVLLTDGVPNTGCPGYKTGADSRACGRYLVQEVLKLRNIQVTGKSYDIKTYVIGFGQITVGSGGNQSLDAQNLNDMASAGGTGKYFQANDLAQLRKALETIANNAGNQKEICNKKDDNCDGKIDENLVETCQGACGSGQRVCQNGAWTDCSAPKAKGKEICNNIDDDCNGKIDDGLTKDCPKTNDCGKNTTQSCVAGKWSGCTGNGAPPEICDGKDNDCDGNIDNGVSRACKTACGDGIQPCINADWSACTARRPSIELCNGIDDDCDGKIDDDASCNGKCVGGRCYRRCEQECPAGQECGADGLCLEKTCDPACTADKTCLRGFCVPKDCSKPGGACRTGEICRQGSCVKDPCVGITCGADQFCRDGKCQISCEKISCVPGQNCVDGKCTTDPCEGKSCPAGQSCYRGACIGSSGCPQKACSGSQACVNGACVDDVCKGVTCPGADAKCVDGQCYGPSGPSHHDPNDPTKPVDPKGNPIDPNNPGTPGTPGTPGNPDAGPGTPGTPGTPSGPRGSGGGCVCSVDGGQSNTTLPLSLLFLGLLLPFAIRRRFRR